MVMEFLGKVGAGAKSPNIFNAFGTSELVPCYMSSGKMTHYLTKLYMATSVLVFSSKVRSSTLQTGSAEETD